MLTSQDDDEKPYKKFKYSITDESCTSSDDEESSMRQTLITPQQDYHNLHLHHHESPSTLTEEEEEEATASDLFSSFCGLDMIMEAAAAVDYQIPPPPHPHGMVKKVAVACTNCKRAHVACNLERPCRRCESLDKECIDTQHKRRGRPPNVTGAKPLSKHEFLASSSISSLNTAPTTPLKIIPSPVKINIYLALDGTIAKAGSEVWFLFGKDATVVVGRNIREFMPIASERDWISNSLARFGSGESRGENGAQGWKVIKMWHDSRGPVPYQVFVSLSTMIENFQGSGIINRYAFLSFCTVAGGDTASRPVAMNPQQQYREEI